MSGEYVAVFGNKRPVGALCGVYGVSRLHTLCVVKAEVLPQKPLTWGQGRIGSIGQD